MQTDEQDEWSEEVRQRLERWAAWTRGNETHSGTSNILATLIRQAAGEVPGLDTSINREFTLEIEAVDKAIAKIRVEADRSEGGHKKYLKAAKRVLMSTYLGREGTKEISERIGVPEDRVKALLWYAESFVGRMIPIIEQDLQEKQEGYILKSV